MHPIPSAEAASERAEIDADVREEDCQPIPKCGPLIQPARRLATIREVFRFQHASGQCFAQRAVKLLKVCCFFTVTYLSADRCCISGVFRKKKLGEAINEVFGN